MLETAASHPLLVYLALPHPSAFWPLLLSAPARAGTNIIINVCLPLEAQTPRLVCAPLCNTLGCEIVASSENTNGHTRSTHTRRQEAGNRRLTKGLTPLQ